MIDFEQEIKKLRGTHQPCFLLAVIDAIELDAIINNEIRYEEPRMLECYDRYFGVAVPSRPPNFKPWYPYMYMGSLPFWNLHGADGTIVLGEGTQSEIDFIATRGLRRVLATVAYASLDEMVFQELLNPVRRDYYRKVIIDSHFSNIQDAMWTAVRDVSQQMLFEQELAQHVDDLEHPDEPDARRRITRTAIPREAEFRRVVLHAYGYTCAATGWRLETADRGNLLEAAHIIPLSTRVDNSPRNGMALTPTVHKAMDSNLIAPGPDYRWHASKFLRDRAKSDAGADWLWKLNRKPVMLPDDPRLRPSEFALELRKSNLV